jgi:hypothetical protein
MPFLRIVRDAAAATLVSALLALAVNGLRTDGIPFIADREYELFVPCPEPLGEVTAMKATELPQDGVLLIDARAARAFSAWHASGSRNVEFDYLEGVPDAVIREVASSGAGRVVVYGDGEDPDSGRELARELAGRGVRNVQYVEGGYRAVQEAGR